MTAENYMDQTQDDDKVRRTDNGWKEGDGSQPLQLATPNGATEPTPSPGARGLATATADPISALLSVAASQIGTVEDGNGCQKYGAFYGMNCVAWCAEFVWWTFNQAGLQNLICKSAYTPTFFKWFEDHNEDPSDIRRGDVVFYDWGMGGLVSPGSEGRIDHVGIVELVIDKNTIQTIEGNTTPPTGTGNQGAGGGVWRRQRSMSCVAGWGRPAYPSSPVPAPTPPSFDPNSLPSLAYGMKANPHVALFQKLSNGWPWNPALPVLPTTGNYLDETARLVQKIGEYVGVNAGDGHNVGPQLKAALAGTRGWRW